MADELRPYLLETADGQSLPASRDYTGKGKATYPNEETYEGDFVDGVNQIFFDFKS
mgnify:CR=1 FL=1